MAYLRFSRLWLTIVLVICPLGLPVRASGAGLSADEIVKKADEARAPQGDFTCIVKVTDADEGEAPMESTYKVYSRGGKDTLVETAAPPRLMGRKLLMRGNDLWLYLPSVKRPTRVGFQQRLTGEVSNGDIARTDFSEDYDATLVGNEKVGTNETFKLHLTAKRKDVTYNAVDYWVDVKTLRPMKAAFYALSGKLLKTGIYEGFMPAMGKMLLSKMTITDALNPSRRSSLNYLNYRREKLSDRLFNKESLAE